MDAPRLRRMLLVAALGALLAGALSLLWSARVSPTAPVRIVAMEPTRVHTIPAPAGAPPMAAEPAPEAYDPRFTTLLENARDRADWIAGAVVECDLGPFVPQGFEVGWEDGDGPLHAQALVEAEDGLRARGPVDVLSHHPIGLFGRVPFVVREPSGTARVRLPVGQRAASETAHAEGAWVEVVAGETRELALAVPPEPPFYQPPDLDEVATVSEVAMYYALDPVVSWIYESMLEGPVDPEAEGGPVP